MRCHHTSIDPLACVYDHSSCDRQNSKHINLFNSKNNSIIILFVDKKTEKIRIRNLTEVKNLGNGI